MKNLVSQLGIGKSKQCVVGLDHSLAHLIAELCVVVELWAGKD